jgi:hypothetical protein
MNRVRLAEHAGAVRQHTRPYLEGRADVESGLIDGSQGPRRCSCGCRAPIGGTPLVSEGVPYIPACYLRLRAELRRRARTIPFPLSPERGRAS